VGGVIQGQPFQAMQTGGIDAPPLAKILAFMFRKIQLNEAA
jgi:hypothetical protein